MFIYLNDGTGTKIVVNLITLQMEAIRSEELDRLGVTDFSKKSILYNDGKIIFLLCKNENAPQTIRIYAKGCSTALYTFSLNLPQSHIKKVTVTFLKKYNVFEVDVYGDKKFYSVLIYKVNNEMVKPIYRDRYMCPLGSTLAIDNHLNVKRQYKVVNAEDSAREYAELYGILKYRVKGYKMIYNKCSKIGHITWQHTVDLRTLEHTSRQLGRYDTSSEVNGA